MQTATNSVRKMRFNASTSFKVEASRAWLQIKQLAEMCPGMVGHYETTIGLSFAFSDRPGSGKTQALRALLDPLGQMGENAIVLAPTAKASLRLGSSAKGGSEWKAETIDLWIFRSGLGSYLSGRVSLNTLGRSNRFQHAHNVVLDEMSMVDLRHLALLFRTLEVHQSGSIKRVILVGDENQLPLIGWGRPFYDIISYFREDADREKRNMVRVTTNCRQQQDPVVLDAAYLFAGKNRYHTDLYERILAGGKISPFLSVHRERRRNTITSGLPRRNNQPSGCRTERRYWTTSTMQPR